MFWELVPILVIAALFWLLLIRPVQRRQRAAAAMQHELVVGQRVVTTSGFQGTVRALAEDTLQLELAPGVEVTLARAAVGGLLLDDTRPDADPDPAHDSDDAVALPRDDTKEG